MSLTFKQQPPVSAVTDSVSRHGALVLSKLLHGAGTTLRIQNELTLKATDCRVVWGEADSSGTTYTLGIEFVDDTREFWGDVYERAWRQG